MNLDNLKNCKILVIGDIIVDDFIYTTAKPGFRLSPEAPVPVVSLSYNEKKLGGACNVAANLKSLGCHTHLCGILGADRHGKICSDLIDEMKILSTLIESDSPTISKTRIICDNQHVVRLDDEKKFDEKYNTLLQSKIQGLREKYDAVIVSDYGKGTISQQIVDFVKSYFSDSLICVDPKPTYYNSQIDLYQGVTCVTPNLPEAKIMAQVRDASLTDLSIKIKSLLNCDFVIITLSEKGMVTFDGNDVFKVPAHSINFDDMSRPQRRDVTGAGDTLIATLAASLCAGFSIKESVFIAGVAAAIVVNKMGTETCSLAELQKEICESNVLT